MSDPMWLQLLAPAFKVVFLGVSLIGIGLGVCLIVRGEATLRTLNGMNHWVSSRRAMKPLEVPHNVEPVAKTGKRGIGIVVAAIGIYSFIVLIMQFDPGKLAEALGQHPRYSVAAIAIDS